MSCNGKSNRKMKKKNSTTEMMRHITARNALHFQMIWLSVLTGMCKWYIPVNDRVHEFGTWQNGAMYSSYKTTN
jgi:hypothetical protein